MANGFSVTIGAVDHATKTINALNKRLAAAQAPAKAFNRALTRFSDLTGLSKVSGGFREISQFTRETLTNVTRLVPPLAALTGAASIAGLGELAERFGRFGVGLTTTANRAHVTTASLQKLQDAVQLGGGDPNAVGGSLATLQDQLTNIRQGLPQGIPAKMMLNTMFYDKPGEAERVSRLSADKAFDAIQKRFTELYKKDPTNALRMVEPLLGNVDGLLPAISRSSDGFADLKKQAGDLDPPMTDKALADAEKLNRAFEATKITIKNLGLELGGDLGPALTPVVQSFADLIHDNQQEIGEGARHFADWLKTVQWKRIGDDIKGIGGDADAVATAMGGWKTAGEVALAYFALTWVPGMRSSILGVLKLLSLIPGFRAATASIAYVAGLREMLKAQIAADPSIKPEDRDRRLAEITAGQAGAQLPEDTAGRVRMPGEPDPTYGALPQVGHWLKSHFNSLGGVKHEPTPLPPAIEQEIADQARKRGLDPKWMIALARKEHGVNPDGSMNTSPTKAYGVMQLEPRTAEGLHVDPKDVHQNIAGGLDYFLEQLKKTGGNSSGDYQAASAAYNAGPSGRGVAHYRFTGDGTGLPYETQDYVSEIHKLVDSGKIVVPPPASVPAAPAAAGPAGNAVLKVELGPGLKGRVQQHGDNFKVQPLATASPMMLPNGY